MTDLEAALATIDRLQAELRRREKIYEIQNAALLRYRPCSDHNGKVGHAYQQWECQWCRAERAEAKAERLQALYAEEYAAVARVWNALGIATYEQAGGREISQIVAELVSRDQRREQLLRECLLVRDIRGTSLAARIRAELEHGE